MTGDQVTQILGSEIRAGETAGQLEIAAKSAVSATSLMVEVTESRRSFDPIDGRVSVTLRDTAGDRVFTLYVDGGVWRRAIRWALMRNS